MTNDLDLLQPVEVCPRRLVAGLTRDRYSTAEILDMVAGEPYDQAVRSLLVPAKANEAQTVVVRKEAPLIAATSTPLSRCAQEKIKKVQEQITEERVDLSAYAEVRFFLLLCCGFITLPFVAMLAGKWIEAVLMGLIFTTILLSFRWWRFRIDQDIKKDMEPVKKAIEAENQLDFQKSEELRAALTPFTTRPVTDFQNTDPVLDGRWQPFRVERSLGTTVRSDIGEVKLKNALKNFLYDGCALDGLFDVCSIIYLQDEVDTKTLRVLVPSNQVTAKMLLQTYQAWLKAAVADTYVHGVLKKFSVPNKLILDPITHTNIIDALDLACQRPHAERPFVSLRGFEVVTGTVLATELTLGAKRSVFFPSDYFRKLNAKISQFIEKVVSIVV